MPISQLAISLRHDRGRTVLSLSGELDIATVRSVQLEVRRLFEGGAPVVALDLRELDFMDSSGVSLLLALERLAQQGQATFEVIHGAGAGHRLLVLTGAHAQLRIVPE